MILEAGALAMTDNCKYSEETADDSKKHGMAMADEDTATARAAGDPERDNAGPEVWTA